MGQAQEPVQRFTVSDCYDATTNHQTGTIELTRHCESDNLADLTVDDGQGNRATVVLGWCQAVTHMQQLGAVAVHM